MTLCGEVVLMQCTFGEKISLIGPVVSEIRDDLKNRKLTSGDLDLGPGPLTNELGRDLCKIYLQCEFHDDWSIIF